MSQYKYAPLDLGVYSTRILRLLPNKENAAPIECQLINYPLHEDRSHQYEALSYTWGGSAKPQSISIANYTFPVSENLHKALLQLRDHTFDRALWVDAICINQKDVGEKEKQIQIMGRIYSQASQVVVWLGAEADDSTKAMEYIRAAADNMATTDRPSWEFDISDKEATNKLFLRPWFRRIWVLQEVGLARSVQVICGHVKLNGYTFFLGIQKLCGDSTVNITGYHLGGAIFRPQYGTHSLRQLPLASLLDMHSHHQTTIRHDKIYALLGLCSDDLSGTGLLPNYGIPWDKLFQQLIKHILCEEVPVRTWPDKEIAIIQARGWVLGCITEVQSDGNNRINLAIKLADDYDRSGPFVHENWTSHWTVQASAKDIKQRDIICILQGASNPSIIRYSENCFEVIVMSISYQKSQSDTTLHRRSKTVKSARNLHLIWSWETSPTNISDLGPEPFGTKLRIDEILWDTNAALHEVLNHPWGSRCIAWKEIETLVKVFAKTLGNEHQKTLMAIYGLALAYSAAHIGQNENQNEKRGVDRVQVRRVLRETFGCKNLSLLTGNHYSIWKYIDDVNFVSGKLEDRIRTTRRGKIPELLRRLK